MLILGLRDFVDDPRAVRIEWARDDVWSLLERYDRILVYGDERIGTTATDLGLATTFPGRVHHVGYLGRAGLCRPHGGRPSPPTVVVTTGGGGDGLPLLDRYADFLESQPAPLPFRSIVVTGPLLAPRRRDAITTRLSRVDHDVDIVEFTDRMEQLVAEADTRSSRWPATTRSSRPLRHERPCCSSPVRRPAESRLSAHPG